MKKCRVCKETKSLSYFHKKHDNRDGLSTVCKKCKKETDHTDFGGDIQPNRRYCCKVCKSCNEK